MRNLVNWSVGFAAVVGAVLAFSPIVFTQNAPQPAAAQKPKPDISGIWNPATKPRAGFLNPGRGLATEAPEMTPWAAEKYRLIREGPKRHKYDRGNEAWDPAYHHCMPFGPTRPYTNNQLFEIRQFGDDLVYIIFTSNHEIRRVYLDGREHPSGWPFGWFGHSTGKWEGDTLVVDTVGLNDLTWIDTMGLPHSDQLHIIERIKRVEPETLQIDFRFEDPKAYPKPWTGKRVFELMKGPRAEILEDILCEEHLMLDHLPYAQRGELEPWDHISAR